MLVLRRYMEFMRKTCFLLVYLLCIQSWAQINTPKYSNEFMYLGVGARALALGNAQSAITDDASAIYWNPAALWKNKNQYDFSLMHAEYFGGLAKYDFVAFATPIDEYSHLGSAIIRFGVDDIPDTRFLFDASGAINYDNIRFFSAADYAFLLSYSRKSKKIKDLSLGTNLKIIHRSVGAFANAWGFGLDFSLLYSGKRTEIGLVAKDFTGTFNAWSINSELLHDQFVLTGNSIPENSTELTVPRLILGVGHRISISKAFKTLLTTDLETTFDGKRNTLINSDLFSIDPKFGIEVSFKNSVAIRIGINQFQDISNLEGNIVKSYRLNTGLGVKIGLVSLDYALTDFGDNSLGLKTHVFSLAFGINQTSDEE